MKRIWDYLDGKKTNLGGTVNAILMWIAIKGWLDESTLTLLASLATIWFGIAAGDKFRKHVQENQAVPRL
jgi:hypothetical protein